MNSSQITLYDYFDFLHEDDIRIRGTRVGIETVLNDYLNASSPEEIAIRYPMLTLEQIYATITYYFHNQSQVENYLERWRKYCEESYNEQLRNPTAAVRRLRELLVMRRQSEKGA